MLDTLSQITGILANISFFGSWVMALYALRKPKTRQHLQVALARLANKEDEA